MGHRRGLGSEIIGRIRFFIAGKNKNEPKAQLPPVILNVAEWEKDQCWNKYENWTDEVILKNILHSWSMITYFVDIFSSLFIIGRQKFVQSIFLYFPRSVEKEEFDWRENVWISKDTSERDVIVMENH